MTLASSTVREEVGGCSQKNDSNFELDRTLDLPIEGLLGREYEQPISLSLIANNAVLINKGEVNVEISVADDAGHETSIVKTIKLKK